LKYSLKERVSIIRIFESFRIELSLVVEINMIKPMINDVNLFDLNNKKKRKGFFLIR